MSNVTVRRLEEIWNESRDDPFALFESDDPNAEVGSYVIESDERVPETGTTSHAGDEISVILSGAIDLVAEGERTTVGPESVTVIPSGIEHYSENTTDEPVRLVYVVLGDL